MPKTEEQTSLIDDLFPEIEAGKDLINLVRNPPPWLQSLPTQTADFLFGPEWASERKTAEATPAFSKERWAFGGKTVAPFLMFGGKPGKGPAGFRDRPLNAPPSDVLGNALDKFWGNTDKPEGPVGQFVGKALNKFWGNEPWLPDKKSPTDAIAERLYRNGNLSVPPDKFREIHSGLSDKEYAEHVRKLESLADMPFFQGDLTYKPRQLTPPAEPPPEAPRTFPGDVFNYKALPFGGERPPVSEPEAPLQPPDDWTLLDDFLQEPNVKITPDKLKNITGMYEIPQSDVSSHGKADYLDFIPPGKQWSAPYGYDFAEPPEIMPRPENRWMGHWPEEGMGTKELPPPPEDDGFDFTQYMQSGGVAGEDRLEDVPISMFPDYVPIPDAGLYVDQIPPSPEYPTHIPQEEVPFYDSADFSGAANYIYVDPRAGAPPSPSPSIPAPARDYYGALDDLRAERIANRLSSSFSSSLPPASGSSPDQQVAMLNQWASMQDAARRFDAAERRRRLLQERYETENRFGPPVPAF